MPKIMNPNRTPPDRDGVQAAIKAELAARSGDKKDAWTFDDIRAALTGKTNVTDGEIHQAAIDAGYDVILD